MFAKHHYLSHVHNNAANVYVAFVNEQLAGFISIIQQPHPTAKRIKRVHRLVIMPDYQGAGIGLRLLNFIGKKYLNDKYRYRIRTSAPSLVNALKKDPKWICTDYGRMKHGTNAYVGGGVTQSSGRITVNFEYKL